MSSTAKNLERIVESIEQHDANCNSNAKAVLLSPFEFDRLGFDRVRVRAGLVPLKPDESLGSGRFRIVCDGYHGPKKEEEQKEVVETPAPAELVPAGEPWPHRGGPKG